MSSSRICSTLLVLLAAFGCAQFSAEKLANLDIVKQIPNNPPRYHVSSSVQISLQRIIDFLERHQIVRIVSHSAEDSFIAWTENSSRSDCLQTNKNSEDSQYIPAVMFVQVMVLPAEAGSSVMFRASCYDSSNDPLPRVESLGVKEMQLFSEIFHEN